MSRMSAACASRSVSRASSGLGVGSPLGWLCTTSSAVVPGVRHAGTNTSGSEMGVLERVPRESTCQARSRWRVERHATAKTSTGLAGQQRRQRGGGDSRIAEGLRRQPNCLALVIAQRAVRADELADAMSAGETVVCSR